MRDIRFRAWNKKLKKMSGFFNFEDVESDGGYGDIYNPKIESNFEITAYHLHDEEKYILMQFTGLLDKNSKEIYEGDIVINKFYGREENYKYVVVWDKVGACFCLINKKKYDNFEPENCNYDSFELQKYRYFTEDYKSLRQIEHEDKDYYHLIVIGNIYENPELLKGGD